MGLDPQPRSALSQGFWLLHMISQSPCAAWWLRSHQCLGIGKDSSGVTQA